MTRILTIGCFLVVLIAVPLWMLLVGFSPMLFDPGPANMTKLQRLVGGGVIAALWLIPVWVIAFGWRTIRGWRDANARPALLMALPAVLIIGFMAAVNFASFAP